MHYAALVSGCRLFYNTNTNISSNDKEGGKQCIEKCKDAWLVLQYLAL